MGDKNKAVVILKNCAGFCWKNYPGTYTLKWLENLLIEIAGESIDPEHSQDKHQARSVSKNLNVLHVVTEGYETGGHTRLIINWITADR